MNRRQIKKTAKAFLDGKKIRVPFRTETRCPSTDGTPIIVEQFPVRHRLTKEIMRQAQERGWNGCHWDSPFIVDILE